MNIYTMSSSGDCPRAIAAPMLGYEPIAETEHGTQLLRHASRHEQLVADYLTEDGYILIDGGLCGKCLEHGVKRYGIHVEFETILIKVIGHLDRRIKVGDDLYPLEIKSLGRFTFDKFKRYRFEAFPGYAGQIALYMKAENKPSFYAVCNRDTGELLKLSIPYNGEIVQLQGFQGIESPVDPEDIIDKLHLVELSIRDGKLPETTYDEKDNRCRYCRVKYLCLETKEDKEIPDLTLPNLLEAADLFKEGKEYERLAEERIEQAKQVFLNHAQTEPKFRVGNVSVIYRGERTRNYLSEPELKKLVAEEIIQKAYRESKPYPDISIRILKEG